MAATSLTEPAPWHHVLRFLRGQEFIGELEWHELELLAQDADYYGLPDLMESVALQQPAESLRAMTAQYTVDEDGQRLRKHGFGWIGVATVALKVERTDDMRY